MRISIGSDHRGFQAKSKLIESLRAEGHDLSDKGTNDNKSVDYPDFASQVAQQVAAGDADRGILICATGIGMSIAANKVRGVRAANCHDAVTVEMSRRHNDANVLCLSGDLLGEERIERLVELWLKTEFEGGRHGRRVDKIEAIEREHTE